MSIKIQMTGYLPVALCFYLFSWVKEELCKPLLAKLTNSQEIWLINRFVTSIPILENYIIKE